MSRTFLQSRIIRVEQVAPATRLFTFQVDDADGFPFTAGQFVTLDLPIGDKPKDRWRSYSIASAPAGDGIIELVIVQVEGGKGTRYLFEEATVGTEVMLMGPLGRFTLPEPTDQEICFICTGTGIAPFRSMLWDLLRRRADTPAIHLIYGTRYQQDILFGHEMEELSQSLPQFSYHPTLSREESDSWTGLNGYVHPVYEALYADKRPAHFYLCGWKNMIDEARERLAAMGYPASSIHLEIYG